ncbi:MAG: hypothetical protein JNK60_01475, partial [Acidobacteria bacterium]|nr:hypothetical protein [Acidobacteriota bacterium]
GILSAVMSLGPPPIGSGKPLVRSAVAASGLDLAGSPTRRAVLLLLGPYPKDVSELPDEGLRRYLEALGVPYRVLRLGRANPKGWGSVADAFTLRLLEAAVFQVGEDLERQRVVWIAGHHRPGSIRLGGNSKELAWAR